MCTHFPPFVQQCQCSSVSLFRFSPGGKHHHHGKRKKLFPVQKFRFQISALLDVCNNGSPAPEQCRFKVSIKIQYLLLSVDILKRSPCTVPKRRAHRREKFCTKVSHDYGFAQRVKRRPERLYTELLRHLNETMGCSMQFCREERRRVGTE